MKMQSHDVTGSNIDKIAKLFPQCVTERKDKDGKTVLGIDFEKLRDELSADVIDDGEERYQFTWPNKKAHAHLANTPTTKTLRPCREESVDFDHTQNIYIEGDNLDVLKIIRETYLGKVKMIYIDPPYNTGNDFVYNDDFSQDADKYQENSGQFDKEGYCLVQNTESNGRFHTDWLNMIYSRLKVAKDLLTDDGVIFISIDSHEQANLKKVCDEVFGERNFVDIFNWAKTETPENLSVKCRQIIEYVLCYQKNRNNIRFKGIQKFSSSSNGLLNQPNAIGVLEFPANKVTTNIPNGIIHAGMYGTDKYKVELLTDVEVKDGLFINNFKLRAKFKWQQKYLDDEISKGTIISIPTMKFSPAYEKREYAPEVPTNLINSKVGVGTNENAGEHQLHLFKNKVFNFPKPTSLMKYLFGFIDDKENDYIVLDFFSGSASTAQAVMEMNAETRKGKVRYIMVQLKENLYESLKNASSKSQQEIMQNAISLCEEMNRDKNLCEVAKERIRRAGKKIKEKNADKEGIDKLDTGFRVLKLDSSNMQDVYYTPKEFTEQDLFADNVKPDRTAEDLLFQVMLDLGVELSATIEQRTIDGKQVFFVNDNYLIACFDDNIAESTITEIAKKKPYYFVMRDSSLASDNVADNFDQLFETYSKDTIRKII